MRQQIREQEPPVICISLVGQTVEKDIEIGRMAESAGANCLELRADYLNNPTDRKIEKLAQAINLPVIITNRVLKDGGMFRGNEVERTRLFSSFASCGFRTFDIEFDLSERQPLISMLHKINCEVILSIHNYSRAFRREEIRNIAEQMEKEEADIAKIASYASSEGDLLETLYATSDLKKALHIPYILVAMGSFGNASRILGPKLGSHLTFCSLNRGIESAPGQLTIEEYHILANRIADSKTTEPGKLLRELLL